MKNVSSRTVKFTQSIMQACVVEAMRTITVLISPESVSLNSTVPKCSPQIGCQFSSPLALVRFSHILLMWEPSFANTGDLRGTNPCFFTPVPIRSGSAAALAVRSVPQRNCIAQWQPERRDTRRLSDLINLWFSHHGSGLESGEDTKQRLKAVADALGDPVVDRFTVDQFAEYRTKRLTAGISANNLNREHAYFRAVFNELIRLGYWNKENPLAKLRQFKIQENELTYLTLDQVEKLLDALKVSSNPHAYLVTKICLSTGARWSEAETLRMHQIVNGLVQFSKTKSGKIRAVPIETGLEAEIRTHYAEHGIGDRIFGTAFSAFRKAIDRANIELPDGQLTHSLRHTFASHFMMAGRNILTLQKILGHANLTMTIRYAHLAPDHLQEAKEFNPLALLSKAAA